MIKRIDITNPITAKEVLNIQIPAYKIEAEIMEYEDLPPLKDTVDTLQQCGETFVGYYINYVLCGVISYKVVGTILDVHRLFVNPTHLRKGIAKRLLEYMEQNEEGIDTIIVSTGSKNIPAINFYLSHGFTLEGETKINERLSLSHFRKKITL